MPGTLYIVSTPIGNLEDITYRAVRVLTEVDLIACEDTRHTKKLLNHYGISTKLTSYHEHNEISKSEKIISLLKEGKNIAIVSDAGTPCISDPGYILIKNAAESGIAAVTVPGPSSFLSALTVSGISAAQFTFLGFLPRTKKQVLDLTEKVKNLETTLVFFESPKRLKKSIGYLAEGLGSRKASICRELTKIHEEVFSGTLEEIQSVINDKGDLKGEICIVIDGFKEDRETLSGDSTELASNKLLSLKKLGLSLKDAVKVVSKETGVSKKTVYQKALDIWDN